MAGSNQTYSGVPHVVRYFRPIVKKNRVSQQTAIKVPKISYFTKIRPVGDELRHANRQTNGQTRRSLLAIFAEYANMPKNRSCQIWGIIEQTWKEFLIKMKFQFGKSILHNTRQLKKTHSEFSKRQCFRKSSSSDGIYVGDRKMSSFDVGSHLWLWERERMFLGRSYH